MQILSHRGYWKHPNEKNTIAAFHRSFDLGFGTETDIRDHCGELVISHDVPGNNALLVETFFDFYSILGKNTPLAINIKADGLTQLLQNLLLKYDISNYFVFDMSVPDTLAYQSDGLYYFTRQSEYEQAPALYDDAAGVWMDCFKSDWIRPQHILAHTDRGKQVCLVSPELHKREHNVFWQRLKDSNLHLNPLLLLGTDVPETAREHFE